MKVRQESASTEVKTLKYYFHIYEKFSWSMPKNLEVDIFLENYVYIIK